MEARNKTLNDDVTQIESRLQQERQLFIEQRKQWETNAQQTIQKHEDDTKAEQERYITDIKRKDDEIRDLKVRLLNQNISIFSYLIYHNVHCVYQDVTYTGCTRQNIHNYEQGGRNHTANTES